MPRASTARVEALGVVRNFQGRIAVSDFNLLIEPGSIHALLGPNGAGKTTVLKMVAGLMATSAGAILVGGVSPQERSVRGRIGWMPASDRSFYLRLTGRQNLTFFARLHGFTGKEAQRRSDLWMTRVGLAENADRPVREYSHGMVKRLTAARALLSDQDVLVVDEATHDLDPRGRDDIKQMVREAADGGACVLWATQRLVELRAFADEVTVLDIGETRFTGTVSDLAARGGSQSYLLRFETGTEGRSAELSWGRIDSTGNGNWRLTQHEGGTLTDSFAELAALGLRVASCTEETPDLERAFLRLTASAPQPHAGS